MQWFSKAFCSLSPCKISPCFKFYNKDTFWSVIAQSLHLRNLFHHYLCQHLHFTVLDWSTQLIVLPAASSLPPLQLSCCLGPSSRITGWLSSTASTFQMTYSQPGFSWICKPSGSLEGVSQKFRAKPKGGGQEDSTNSLPWRFTAWAL